MVAQTAVKEAVKEQETDLSWLFYAERGSVAVIHEGGKSTAYVKGTETIYALPLPGIPCECPSWLFRGHCAHQEFVRQYMQDQERLKRFNEARERIKCGTCPVCGADLVSHLSFDETKGFLMEARCWDSLADPPTCSFRRVS